MFFKYLLSEISHIIKHYVWHMIYYIIYYVQESQLLVYSEINILDNTKTVMK